MNAPSTFEQVALDLASAVFVFGINLVSAVGGLFTNLIGAIPD